jgi:hypothetical protein
LKVTLASGGVQTWFFDEESFLVLRKEVTFTILGSRSPDARFMSSSPVGGRAVAHRRAPRDWRLTKAWISAYLLSRSTPASVR